MKTFSIFYFLLLFSLFSCSKTPQAEIQNEEDTVVGNDKDPNGCIGSAGYTWSEAKKECIRIFESGTAFISYDSSTGAMDSTKVAYVVLSNDKLQAEVFYGGTDKPVLMDALPVVEGETIPKLFKNGIEQVELIYHKDSYILRYQEKPTYVQAWSADSGLGFLLEKN